MLCLEFYISAKQGFLSPCRGPGADKDSRDISPQPYCVSLSGSKPQSPGQPVLPPYGRNLANFCPAFPVGAGCSPPGTKNWNGEHGLMREADAKIDTLIKWDHLWEHHVLSQWVLEARLLWFKPLLCQLLVVYPGASQFTSLCFSVIIYIMEP